MTQITQAQQATATAYNADPTIIDGWITVDGDEIDIDIPGFDDNLVWVEYDETAHYGDDDELPMVWRIHTAMDVDERQTIGEAVDYIKEVIDHHMAWVTSVADDQQRSIKGYEDHYVAVTTINAQMSGYTIVATSTDDSVALDAARNIIGNDTSDIYVDTQQKNLRVMTVGELLALQPMERCDLVAAAEATTPYERVSAVVTAAEAATLLDVAPSTVTRAAADGKIAGRKAGRIWLLDRESVMAYGKHGPR